jgi:hypothetical protein
MQNKFSLAFLIAMLAFASLCSARAETTSKLIPIPVYATLPNEGSTWGFMPVYLFVDKETERTQAIMAPDVTWNQVIGTTGTFRYFAYPSDITGWTVVLSGSTRTNWGGKLEYEHSPVLVGEWTDHVLFRFGRNIFYRFFGIGPDTPEDAQSSHTRLMEDLTYRRGMNLLPHFNVGARVRLTQNQIQAIGVSGFPLSTNAFPNTPGMSSPGAISEEQFDLYYDTRKSKDYSTEGFYAGLLTGPAQGITAGTPRFWDTTVEAKELFTESDRFQAGARVYVHYVNSPQVPFYYQTSLGGSYLMRGFIEDRYIDQGGWTAEFEQRIQLCQTHIYGVTADWRIDPFVAVGQVFGDDSGPFTNVRVVEGLGFRAWVRPNVLGRVDVAYGGVAEGLNTYVELGYPF